MLAGLISKVDAFFTGPVDHGESGVIKPDFNTQMAIERTLLARERQIFLPPEAYRSAFSFPDRQNLWMHESLGSVC